MYTISDAAPAGGAVATAVILPNTGAASTTASLAIAVAVGMVIWGVMYVRAN